MSVLRGWGDKDPEGAAAWVQQLPPGQFRNQALGMAINALAATNPQGALERRAAIGEGMRVRIREGPLQGIEGWVEQRYGMSTVLLRLDFISQAAAVKIEAHQLQLI